MGFKLLPLFVLSFLVGLFAVENSRVQDSLSPPIVEQAVQGGQTFVAYRDAVANYLRANPTFVGSVSKAALASQGGTFSSGFLSSAGNAITPTGATGRVITSYALLPQGALNEALAATENDASLGISSGSNWTSAVFGNPAIPLSTPVPSGAIVSVVQVGK